MAFGGLLTAFSFFRTILTNKGLLSTGQAGDEREKALLAHVLKTAEKGDPRSLINSIDAYATTYSWYMNIGDIKGSILEKAVQKHNPKTVLEIGTYCGYSAVRIASQLQGERSRLLALEMSADNCNIANQIIEYAGLKSKVQIMQGKFHVRLDEVKQFLEDADAPCFDFVFLDHWKQCYMPDYVLLKENGLIGKGSVIFCDNMGALFGPADFRKYVATHTEELETEEIKSNVEYIQWLPDAITISTFKLDRKLTEIR